MLRTYVGLCRTETTLVHLSPPPDPCNTDTLVVGVNVSFVDELIATIGKVGARYGMSLHWDKFQAMSICTDCQLKKPDGSFLKELDSFGQLKVMSPIVQ